jgi:hypothetical protein
MRKVLKVLSVVVSIGTVVASVFVKNPENKKKAEDAAKIAGSVIEAGENSATLGYNKST